MPRDAIILGDLVGKLDVLVVECAKCGRRGRYRLDRLIAQHRPEARVTDWLRYVARDCDRLKAASYSDQCGVRCPHLPRVM